MSLFGAINTAISGLSAQSNAFSNISDNVANSQTVGYKRVDTSFIDYLTTSTATQNESGSVVAQPDYANDVQGTITQSDDPLALAITGQGFFAVSEQSGQSASGPLFNSQQYYTRAGDFQMNQDGYLVNSAGEYLNGWLADPRTSVINQNALAPIQVSQGVYNPVPTSTVTLSANLPATPAAGTATAASPISSDLNVYDSLGVAHTVTLNWVRNSQDDWTVSLVIPDEPAPATPDSAEIQFGPTASGNPVPGGTIGQIANATGTVATGGYSANGAATLSFVANFPAGARTITLNLGNYGETTGLTQYAGTQYDLHNLTQNGVPPGDFSSVSAEANGDIVANYDNGQSRVIAQIPLVTFNSPDALQRQDGQAFSATVNSGTPLANAVGSSGAGNLVTESVEGSNVDIATEFSKLIVAQQAYSASAKMVTTADDMLQQTIDMKR
jgi:flagellar hook protein FlgE